MRFPEKPSVLHLWVGFNFEVTSESHERLVYAVLNFWFRCGMETLISNRSPREVMLQLQVYFENH